MNTDAVVTAIALPVLSSRQAENEQGSFSI